MKNKLVLLLLLSLLLCGCGKRAAAEETAAPAEATPAPVTEEESGYEGIAFSTTDRQGNEWTEQSLRGRRIVMLNFFESWCGPCVAELPELQKLHENYADKGLLLLGVYLTEDGIEQVLAQAGVTYPILHYTEELYPYTSQYVPTTVFLSENGELLKQTVGSNSYEDWEAILLALLDTEN